MRFALSVILALMLVSGPAWAAAPDGVGFVPVPQLWFGGRFIIAPNKLWLASALGGERHVQIVDMATGTILRTLDTPPRGSAEGSDPHVLDGLAITADSASVVARLADGSTVAWNAATGARLPSNPGDLMVPPLPPEYPEKDDSAYKIALTDAGDGDESTAKTVEITSGLKTIEPIRFRASNLSECGATARFVTFDGEYLVFRFYGGDGETDTTPAIAYRRENGTFRELWRAPCEVAEFKGFTLLNDGAYLKAFDGLGAGPATVWNLASNRVVARFENADGPVAISADGRTMVAAAFADANGLRKVFTVLKDGKTTAFTREAADFHDLFLSLNGRWLAASGEQTTNVWSIPSGTPKPGPPAPFEASGITNDGVVVEKSTPRDDEDFHGHRVKMRSPDGHWLTDSDGDVFDTKTGRIVAYIGRNYSEDLTHDDHIILTQPDGRRQMIDLATGRRLWTLQITPDVHGYIMTFPDGCVQVSPGADRLVRLVRGFESRPFDAAAIAAFTKPGCKGVPEVIAANEAALTADRKQVEALAKADADKQARLAAEAAAQARREAAERQAWIAGAPAREAEERHQARLVSKAIVTIAGAAPYVGIAKWHFSHNSDDGDAVASIDVPALRFQTLIAIDKSAKAEMADTAVVTILYQPDRWTDAGLGGRNVAAIAVTAEPASQPPHIALHLGGPSGLKYLSYLPLLEPTDGVLKLDRLLPETWFDIPLVMNDLRRATLSIEIGAGGREVIDTALAFKAAHP